MIIVAGSASSGPPESRGGGQGRLALGVQATFGTGTARMPIAVGVPIAAEVAREAPGQGPLVEKWGGFLPVWGVPAG